MSAAEPLPQPDEVIDLTEPEADARDGRPSAPEHMERGLELMRQWAAEDAGVRVAV
jgi:hypothetical protein